MIKKIVPLSKKFTTTIKVTRKYFRLSARSCTGVLNQSEKFGIWYMNLVGK
jgi:hypothetical protein